MEKKFIYLAVILAVISFFAGFGIGSWNGKMIAGKVCQGKLNQAQEEIKWWKSQLEIFYPPLPEEIYSISGKITKIEDKTIWIESKARVSQLPLPGGKEIETKEIKVNTTDETKIVKIGTAVIPVLPTGEPFEETLLKFEDLKVGDQITVTSKENIKGKTEILAEIIQLSY